MGMRRVMSVLGIAGGVLLAALGVSGCATSQAASSISVTSAYVPTPTDAGKHGRIPGHSQQRPRGPADRGAHQRGGTVQLRAPQTGKTNVLTMHTVGEIPIPSDSMVRLNPDNGYLLITGAGPMQDGKAIMLRLTFAEAGTVTVIAVVTNPQNGGSSYFLN